MNSNPELELNQYGFYQIKNKPTAQELKEYYAQKYYQQGKGHYQKEYTEAELTFINNKLKEKCFIINQYLVRSRVKFLLDVGSGEGFALQYFAEQGFEVKGLDYSSFGCEKQNPEFVREMILGDIFENLKTLGSEEKKYDVLLLDNILEHVIDPYQLLEACFSICKPGGILVVEVPNDFSFVQNYLIKTNHIQEQFWIVLPDHLSYFNKEGLINICQDTQWNLIKVISDYPIDFNLFNPLTNYVVNKAIGRSCHLARIELENLMHSISIEKYLGLLESFADLGAGRQLVGFFQKSQ